MSVFSEKQHLVELNEAFRRELVEQQFTSEEMSNVAGFSIRGYRKDLAAGHPVIYLSAGIHGDEPAGPLALRELMQAGEFDSRANWIICPILNPTGLLAGTRENDKGIDLNRRYLNPISDETKGHVAWLKRQGGIDLSISLHEDYESSGFYLYEINCADCPSQAKAVLDTVRPIFAPERAPLIDDHEVREPGWIFHEPEADLPDQWPEAIWLAKHGTALSYTLETPSSAKLQDRVAAHVHATQKLIDTYLNTQERRTST